MRIATILGARPQFVKAAAFSRALVRHKEIKEIIIHTGQHYDANMSEIFFEQMQIPKPDYMLQFPAKNHGEMTGRMLEGVEKILLEEKPDVVLVYGDTNSTLAGALAAVKIHIPIAHVEAGLRSFNRRMPEEINRVVTDHIAQWLFAPTESAVANLTKEGIDAKKIHNVGDIMYDAILLYQELSTKYSSIVRDLDLEGKPFALVTIHRAENTNDPERLHQIMKTLNDVGAEKTVVFPMHPRTKNILKDTDLLKNIKVIEPVGYFDMIALQKNCRLIVTDSGGVQKEAFIHGKYCITVREETEWIELVDNGFNYLANPVETLPGLIDKLWDKKFSINGFYPYGDGKAADKIIDVISR